MKRMDLLLVQTHVYTLYALFKHRNHVRPPSSTRESGPQSVPQRHAFKNLSLETVRSASASFVSMDLIPFQNTIPSELATRLRRFDVVERPVGRLASFDSESGDFCMPCGPENLGRLLLGYKFLNTFQGTRSNEGRIKGYRKLREVGIQDCQQDLSLPAAL